jgi:hypothetical protein
MPLKTCIVSYHDDNFKHSVEVMADAVRSRRAWNQGDGSATRQAISASDGRTDQGPRGLQVDLGRCTECMASVSRKDAQRASAQNTSGRTDPKLIPTRVHIALRERLGPF